MDHHTVFIAIPFISGTKSAGVLNELSMYRLRFEIVSALQKAYNMCIAYQVKNDFSFSSPV